MRAKFIGDKALHEKYPAFYPTPGTMGVVMKFSSCRGLKAYLVKWPKGSVERNQPHWIPSSELMIYAGEDHR